MSPDWQLNAQPLVIEYARTHPTFTAEDLWEAVEAKLGKAPHPNLKGSLFQRALVREKLVARVGHTSAKAAASKGCEIPVWKSMLCPGEGEVQSLQKTLASLHSRVNRREITTLEALRLAYELGAQATF